MQNTDTAKDVDAYIARFPPDVQARLARVRAAIRRAAPEATEAIKYGIPTFVLHGNLVHFAAFTHHVGLYPGPAAITHFADALSPYTSSKGAVQFPFNSSLPLALITRIVRFRAASRAGGKPVPMPSPVRAYLSALPLPQRRALERLRTTILSVAPDMNERLSSGAPFVWHRGRRAVGFGAARHHLSFFIMHGQVLHTHRADLAGYDTSRTVVRFTPERPLPAGLVRTLVRARLAEIERAVD